MRSSRNSARGRVGSFSSPRRVVVTGRALQNPSARLSRSCRRRVACVPLSVDRHARIRTPLAASTYPAIVQDRCSHLLPLCARVVNVCGAAHLIGRRHVVACGKALLWRSRSNSVLAEALLGGRSKRVDVGVERVSILIHANQSDRPSYTGFLSNISLIALATHLCEWWNPSGVLDFNNAR